MNDVRHNAPDLELRFIGDGNGAVRWAVGHEEGTCSLIMEMANEELPLEHDKNDIPLAWSTGTIDDEKIAREDPRAVHSFSLRAHEECRGAVRDEVIIEVELLLERVCGGRSEPA